MPSLGLAVLFGAVQGITEFLPISSTGHLVLLQELFGLDPEQFGLPFDLFLTLGTLLAATWFLRRDLWLALRSPQQRFWLTGITVIVGTVGYFASDAVASALRSPLVVGTSLIVVAFYMLIAERLAPGSGSLTSRRAWITGLAQVVAFIPGVSRSGITIATARLLGTERVTAARWSFLASIPVTALAVASQVPKLGESGVFTDSATLSFYLVGFVTSLVTGYAAISYLLRLLERVGLEVFVLYRVVLGCIVFATLVL